MANNKSILIEQPVYNNVFLFSIIPVYNLQRLDKNTDCIYVFSNIPKRLNQGGRYTLIQTIHFSIVLQIHVVEQLYFIEYRNRYPSTTENLLVSPIYVLNLKYNIIF